MSSSPAPVAPSSPSDLATPPKYSAPLKEYKKMTWKLFKGKQVLIYHLCTACQDRLYHAKDKIQDLADRWVIKIEMCDTCVRANCTATSLLSKPYSRPTSKEWRGKKREISIAPVTHPILAYIFYFIQYLINNIIHNIFNINAIKFIYENNVQKLEVKNGRLI